jgi:hypothetical protein
VQQAVDRPIPPILARCVSRGQHDGLLAGAGDLDEQLEVVAQVVEVRGRDPDRVAGT